MPKTMTQAQAATRAEQILHETLAALHPRPRLDFDPSLGNGADVCVAGIPNADQMVSVNRSAWLRDIPVSQNGSIGRQILAYWRKQGYSISQAYGFDSNQPSINGETKDAFTFDLGTANNGWMSFGTTSPCVYPDGHPPA